MTTQTTITQRNHRRAVRVFWGLLLGATTVSLLGNVAHAVLPYLPRVAVQIGVAAVPPIALLAAVHGIALAVRAGASGKVYCWAVGAVAAIGVGAFSLSFQALSALMQAIGYSGTTAWVFPVIVDAAVAVATLMLIALGDKPARRPRSATASIGAHTSTPPRTVQPPTQGAKAHSKEPEPSGASTLGAHAEWAGDAVAVRPASVHTVQGSAHDEAQIGAGIALDLIASGATTQPPETVLAVLTASRDGASINAAAKAAGINYRTAQRIVEAAQERQLAVAG